MTNLSKRTSFAAKKAFICMIALVLAVFSAIPVISYADESTQGDTTTSFTVHVMNGPDRDTDIAYSKTITLQDLKNADVLQTTPIACNYNKSTTSEENWYILAVKNYASLQDVFSLVTNPNGTGSAWTTFTNGQGGTLQFETTDDPSLYTKWQNFTYANMKSQTSYYKYLQGDGSFYQSNTTTTDIPLAIAFDRIDSKVNKATPSDTTFTSIKNGTYTSTVQFFMGLDDTTLNALPGSGWNMGKRLPNNITDIYVYPAGITPDYTVDE
jgi:hypothetical protein